MSAHIDAADPLVDHWWWRPGWRSGRHFYACHIAMGGNEEFRRLVATYQRALEDVPGLDLIPARWLHLTLQGIGFVDEIDDQLLSDVTAAIRDGVATVRAPSAAFHHPVVRPEAVYLSASPSEPIRALKAVVATAIAKVLPPPLAVGIGGDLGSFRPHVSVAYSNTSQPAEPILERLSAVQAEPVSLDLDEVSILEFHRDHRMYEWTSAHPLRLL
jgi:2'-5' RNA ligase